jgi:hypothetical protein
LFFTLDSHGHNGHSNEYHTTVAKGITKSLNPPSPSPPVSFQSTQNSVVPPTTTSITTKLMNQMKNLAVSSTTTNTTLTSAIQSSSRPISTVSYLSEYEITDTTTQSTKKPTATIAAFPPRQYSTTTDVFKQNILLSDNQGFSSKPSVISKDENMNHYERDTYTPGFSNEGGIQFNTTPGPQTTSVTSNMYVKR